MEFSNPQGREWEINAGLEGWSTGTFPTTYFIAWKTYKEEALTNNAFFLLQ